MARMGKYSMPKSQRDPAKLEEGMETDGAGAFVWGPKKLGRGV